MAGPRKEFHAAGQKQPLTLPLEKFESLVTRRRQPAGSITFPTCIEIQFRKGQTCQVPATTDHLFVPTARLIGQRWQTLLPFERNARASRRLRKFFRMRS